MSKTVNETIAELRTDWGKPRESRYNNHVIVIPVAPADDRAQRAYELFVALQPFDWRLTWDFWSPGKPSQLRCEGPHSEDAVKIVQEWAATMPVLSEFTLPSSPFELASHHG